MSVRSIVLKVTEKARERADQQGSEELMETIETAKTVAMIQMWDADLDLERKITDKVLETLLVQANSLPH